MKARSAAASARDVLTASMSEDELLEAIVGWARMRGWLVHHDRRSDKALQQGDPGFPDLVLARNGRLVVVELKSARGVMTNEQAAWLRAIGGNGSRVESYVWRPAELDVAIAALK